MHLDILDFSQKLIAKCIPVEVHRLHEKQLYTFSFSEQTDFSSIIHYHLIKCLEEYFKICKDSTIGCLITPFHTQYYILCLSKKQDEHLMIGPFLENPMEESLIYPIINNLHLNLDHAAKLKFYYQSIPYIDTSSILEILYTVHADVINTITLPKVYTLDLTTVQKKDSSYNLFLEDMNRNQMYKILEERYAAEDKMLSYITTGDVVSAQSAWTNSLLHNMQIAPRAIDSLRSSKNLMFAANTIFRKAAQAGGVHPVYLDELSGKWAIKIEQATSLEVLSRMPLQMIRAYCLLTKNHSVADYSPIVQKALNFIHLNLSSDLTVKKIATEVGLSPDYLTRLFKNDLGIPVIRYINKKRIYTSLKLLNTTDLSIEEIGDLIGLHNTSYFSTLFKKEIGVSPKQYRDNLKAK